MRYFSFVFMGLLLTSSLAWAEGPVINFKEAQGKDIYEWLSGKGFTFEQSAKNPRKTRLIATEKGMVMEALNPTQSILMLKKGRMTNVTTVEIKWGVNKFPKGANYEKGRRNEATMFYAFFGTEMIDSGFSFIPDSPYFLALRLCETEPINVLRLGGYFHEGGRFVCVAHPAPGETVTTQYDLASAFREAYRKEPPPLTAIGLEFDTTSSQDGGQSSAFVESIRFPSATYYHD